MLETILSAYGLQAKEVILFGNGLINNTWKIITGDNTYILQRINDAVFKNPADIANNISKVATYLEKHSPDYKFVSPIKTVTGEELVYRENEGYFRLFPFVPRSHSKDIAASPAEAFEAATQFGRFTKLIAGISLGDFKTTIPGFHNLTLRYRQFNEALQNGNHQKISKCRHLIAEVKANADIVSEYETIIANPKFKLRATHHDTKISNVLFDEAGKALCVIDLDTLMPGYFISDVGDMLRTYLPPVNEEEQDFSKIKVRDDFYHAIVQGYYNEMKDELTVLESNHFFYAGKFMIYMQALRFITDHISDDVYYGAKYPGQNLVRAGNQMVLLQRLIEKQAALNYK